MVTLMNHTPDSAKSVRIKYPQRIKLFLKPTEEGGSESYYRFRLLWFFDEKQNDRDYPFIVRYVHRVFGKNEENKPIVAGEVVCPVTKFSNWGEGVDPYKDCKVCNYSGRLYNEYNKTGKTDKETLKKSRDIGRKFEAWVPVYVINDPVYDGNNGKLMAFMFGDKKEFEAFEEMVKIAERENNVYNGENAVDFYIKLEKVTETINEGQPDQRTFTKTQIKKMGFTSKPYSIKEITPEALSAFEFDKQLYVTSTREEVDAFYKQFCTVHSVGDIPDEDLEMIDVTPPAKKQSAKPVPPPPAKKEEKEAKKQSDDDFLAGLDDISTPTAKQEETPPPKADKPVEPKQNAKQKEPEKADEIGDKELDALLDF